MAGTTLKPIDRQAGRDWDSYYESFIADVEAATNETESERKKRISRLEADNRQWCAYYFPKYCYAPSPGFHIRAMNRELSNPEWYEVRLWSRELAKDVVEMMVTIKQVLTKQKRNVLFISNSYDKACDLLKPYKINLESNARIIADYGTQQMAGSWADGDFTTTQGASFLAVGAGQSPRGSRDEEVRPDKIIISDIDTDEDVRNPDVISKRWEWFEKAVFPTRSVSKDTQYIWLGNMIAKDCCVVRASEKADKTDTVNLETKTGESSWPEKNKPEHIARIKAKISTMAYEGEYMNNPLSEGDIFKEMVWGKCPPLSSLPFVVNYSDPSPSNKDKQKKGVSFKSQFLIGYKDGKFYVYHGFLEQAPQATFINWFYDQKKYVGDKTQVYNYIENNSLQDPFYEQVTKPALFEKGKTDGFISISPDDRRKPEKPTRIEGNLEPLNRNGQLILNEDEKNNPHMLRLEEQFKLFTMQLKAPADGPDCIEGGVWIINEKIASIKPDTIKIGRVKHNSKKRF
jgi:hypothetical protein